MQKYKILTKISEIYQHKHTQMLIDFISLFIVLRCVFMTIGTIKGVISYDFFHHFDYEFQKKIVNNNLFTHTILLYTPIFLSMISILKRNIGLKDFALSLIFSYLALRFQWFDIIHNFLQDTFIFDKLKESGRTVINNQYTRIIFYIILIITLLILLCRKKTRTLSRIMAFLITTSCFFTLSIFHIAIPMGIFKSVLEEKTQTQKYEIINYKQEDICKTRNCYYIDENGKLEIISEKIKPDNFEQYRWIISKGLYVLTNSDEKVFAEHMNVNAEFLFDYDIIVIKKEQNKYFMTIDNNAIRKYSRESEIMFSFLAIMAHSIWIFGGLALLEFHYYKFKKRLLNKGNE